MKTVLGVSLLALTLAACGGGGGGDSSSSNNEGNNPPVSKAEVKGIYTGKTNQEQNVVGLVDKNNKFWFLYSAPYSSGIAGFMTGNFTVSGNTIKANSGKDFYFGGATVYNTSISGTVDSKKSLKGTITYSPSNQVTFDTVYETDLNNTASNLATIAGTYYGESAIVQGIEGANLTISNTGVISGKGQSGCTFSGKIAAEENAPYYNVDLVFGYSPCYLAGQSVNGVAYYDSANKTLYAVTETSNRDNAVLFLGTKNLR